MGALTGVKDKTFADLKKAIAFCDANVEVPKNKTNVKSAKRVLGDWIKKEYAPTGGSLRDLRVKVVFNPKYEIVDRIELQDTRGKVLKDHRC